MFKLHRKSIVLLLCIVLAGGIVLAGCGNGNDGKGNNAGSSGAAEQVFRMNLFSEPPSLDPAAAQDNNSFTVLAAVLEGLTRLDENAQVQPGVAKDWTVSEDGKTYTFTLREDAKWSNGEPVTAYDFEFAWKRVLDPNAEVPAPYAYQLYYLKNGQAYNEGKADVGEVGVKALDERTLQVELENPTAYFLKLTAFVTYYPVHQATVEANPAWAAEAETFVSNGPFVLKEWNHNESIVLAKNDAYYAKDEIKLQEVRMVMIEEASTELNMFEVGDLDWAGRPLGQIPVDLIPKLKDDPGANLTIKPIASSYYYVFNTTAEPFNNVKVRKALSMAIDRQMLVEEVTKGGQEPAYGMVAGVTGVEKPYREEFDDRQFFQEDYDAAKQLLAEGLAELGLSSFPEATLIYNEGEGHMKLATAITDMWRQNLGIEVKIESQEFGVLLNNRMNLNYQIARAGWGADYDDPMTFIDLFTSFSGNNDTGWKNAQYDELVAKANAEQDPAQRMAYIQQAETILMDEMVILPIYYYTAIWMQKDYVKNVIIDYAGNIDFTRGYIEN
jgi:oligopeptide transport system substrate-binding protein